MKDSAKLLERLKELEERRKRGEISARQFYEGLLDLLAQLKDALVREDIAEEGVKKQIPLLLAFLKAQIGEMKSRGN
ncbi:MAG: hypothetical protein GXO08_01825 [Aquificae bacterium]|nr:hypothetical protein [Aquificota bacterium]